MRYRHTIFALVAAGLLAAGCGAGGDDDITADGEWSLLSVDGEFTAELPGDPGDSDLSEAGTLYSVEDGDREVGIAVTELPGSTQLPPDNVAGLLTQINEAAATAVDGTVVTNEPVSGLAYPAQDAEFTTSRGDDDLVGMTRAILADDRQFQLMVIGSEADRAEVEAIFDRLVESFEPAAGS